MNNRHIVLGITGGIAAYKSAELLRLLSKQGCSVQVAMTDAACHFITPATMQGLSGKSVFTSQWDASLPNGMAHINLSREADAIVIAPASADFIAKLANGLADDLLSTMCLARNCPLLIAPAMNKEMWQNPATQRNIERLLGDGVQIMGPDSGIQACGEEGMGRMLAPEMLARLIADSFIPKLLAGKKILMTAGPTYEAIDAVRGITNRSSGKMGYAIAQAAIEMGAEVVLVSGPTALSSPFLAQRIDVQSAAQMFDEVKRNVAACDIFIAVAAVADYRVRHESIQKIKKSNAPLTLELVPNPDILAYVAALANPPYCVGFAAESENLIEYAEQKRQAKRLPLLVGNLAQNAIGSDNNEMILFDDSGIHPLPAADKLTLARALMQHVAGQL